MILLAFWPREPGQWWARRFGHVTLVELIGSQIVSVDVSLRGVSVRTWLDGYEFFNAHRTATILRVKARGARSHFLMPMTCVTFVKHAIGLRSRVWLPDSLMRTLLPNSEVIHDGRTEAAGDSRATACPATG